MRKTALILCLSALLALAACGGPGAAQTSASPDLPQGASQAVDPAGPEPSAPETAPAEETPAPETAPVEEAPAPAPGNGVLVAYFSATGNTEGIAQRLQAALDADLYEIVPADPYTEADLDYGTSGCRADQEQNDPDARPAIDGGVDDMEGYQVIFLGYPIWWGDAPRIVSTFLERYDFSGKTIVPFCTSGSSPIGSSASALAALAPGARWLEGTRFDPGASQEELAAWVDGLDL